MDLNRYKKEIGFGLVVIAVVCLLAVIIFKEDKENSEDDVPQKSVTIDIPEGDVPVMSNSKSEAYLKGENSTKIEDYWDSCAPDEGTHQPEQKAPSGGNSTPRTATTEELLGLNEPARHSPAPRTAPSNPYRETAEEREARHQRRHEEALELAERMQEGQNGGSEQAPPAETSAVPQETVTQTAVQTKVKRSDVISSLDGWEGDSGLSTLDEGDSILTDDPYTPFRCMFARESKITDGQRVTVILLDDIDVSGISVPRNTHLMATCQLTNRLELEFVNIEIGGRILPLGFEAYDVDGSKGIYCPDAGAAGKTVKNRGADIISSTLSSRLGRVARDVAATGISLVQSADGQRTVSVPAGYTFFIIKKRQN